MSLKWRELEQTESSSYGIQSGLAIPIVPFVFLSDFQSGMDSHWLRGWLSRDFDLLCKAYSVGEVGMERAPSHSVCSSLPSRYPNTIRLGRTKMHTSF